MSSSSSISSSTPSSSDSSSPTLFTRVRYLPPKKEDRDHSMHFIASIIQEMTSIDELLSKGAKKALSPTTVKKSLLLNWQNNL